jgi:hypothetical protein
MADKGLTGHNVGSFIAGLIPSFVFLSTAIILSAVVYFMRPRRKDRRTPLTRELMRGPGHTLAREIERFNSLIMMCGMAIALMPLTFFASYVSSIAFGAAGKSQHTPVIYAVLLAAFVVPLGIALRYLLKKRGDCRLGLDCEMAVGQELHNLMRDGYRVYHDVPAKGFNIDHVVVGRNGVFAVETKGRSKPKRSEVTVLYDGSMLRFPDWTETNYLRQARRQARWLSAWLRRCTGAATPVKPVLVITGWNVHTSKNIKKGPGSVLVLSGNEACRFLSTEWTRIRLSDERIQSISEVLEQVCRDVEPLAYRREQTSHVRPHKVFFARIGPSGRIDQPQ